jgi:uracil-DNA glycosylase
MNTIGKFPTNEPIKNVSQIDQTPKRVFVLGVYASAVHARWIGQDGKTLIAAMAVASEPEIFWTGAGADEIIAKITPPGGIGKLESAGKQFNGPSGRALDEQILCPLGISRKDAWLCDLVPHSCMNTGQEKALKRASVPIPDWPRLPKCPTDATRKSEILAELNESKANILITLGDQPLQWFAKRYGAKPRLGDYGEEIGQYGQLHKLPDLGIQILPLAHPRQIAGLGIHSAKWKNLHENWKNSAKPRIP